MTQLQKELNLSAAATVASLCDNDGIVYQTSKGMAKRFFVLKDLNSFDGKIDIYYSDEENKADKENGDDAILLSKIKEAKSRL